MSPVTKRWVGDQWVALGESVAPPEPATATLYSANFPDNGLTSGHTQNITLNETVDLDETFVIISQWGCSGSSNADRNHVQAHFTDEDTLQLRRHNPFGTLDVKVYVIEVPGAQVQHVVDHDVMGTTDTVTIDSVDLSRTFVMTSSRINHFENWGATHNVRGVLDDATTLRLQRSASDNTATASSCVVQMPDGVAVQSGETTISGLSEDETLTAVDLSRSFVVMRGSTPDPGDFSGVNRRRGWVSGRFPDNETLRLERGSSSGDATYAWYVVEWPGVDVSHHSLALEGTNLVDQETIDNASNSFVVGAFRTSDTSALDSQVRPQMFLDDATTLEVSRAEQDGTDESFSEVFVVRL